MDCIVIGAGFSGLAAADKLRQSGAKVCVIEARDRVGGRSRTEVFDDGLWLDYGGQWLGPGHDTMYALAKRFNQKIWPMWVKNKHATYLDGELKHHLLSIPTTLRLGAQLELGKALLVFEYLCRRVNLKTPWKGRFAKKLDQSTLEEWMEKHLKDPQAYKVFKAAMEAVLAKHPQDVSLLQAVVYFRSNKSFLYATSSHGGAQQDRLEKGTQPLAESLANDLQNKGVEIILNSPVLHVEETNKGITVTTQNGQYKATTVICAIPPVLASKIEFNPPLPSDKQKLLEAMTPGCAMKCFAIYDRPFWRDAKKSGSVLSDQGPIHVCFDVTPPEESRGILMGFIEGREADTYTDMDEQKRKKIVLDQFATYFGERALKPQQYYDFCWRDEEWSEGCYTGVAGPNVLSQVGYTIRKPHGAVFWAGTETATEYMGYFEGAVRAGERAADEVTKRIKRTA